MSKHKLEARVRELLSTDKGCPQCGQTEEFTIHYEKFADLNIGVFDRPDGETRYTTSEDEGEELYIVCPDCEWREDEEATIANSLAKAYRDLLHSKEITQD